MYQIKNQTETVSTVQQNSPHVLLIDDELSICTGIQGILETDGFITEYALSPDDAMEYITTHNDIDIILLDVNLRSDVSGIELLPIIKEKNKYVQIIMFTSYERLDIGLECMKRGAFDFMTKPFDENHFLRIASIALEKKRLEQIQDLYFDMVVHDLKNPLQCICGSFEILKDQLGGSLSEIQKKLFESAESGIQQIQLIIGNILGVTRLENGSLTARRESFNVSQVIKESLNIYDNVRVIVKEDTPQTLRSDKDLYARIVTNIVSNAQRFAEIDSIIEIELEFDDSLKELTTHITNSGSYISEEHRSMIFNKFVGVQKSVGGLKGQNFGLGLTFSKMAVEVLGGKIWIDSDAAIKKTTFSFTIKDFSVI